MPSPLAFRGGKRRRREIGARHGQYACQQIPPFRADHREGSAMAGEGDRSRAHLVQRRPARRQPGARRPDGLRAQAPHVETSSWRWASSRSRSASRPPPRPSSTSSAMLIEGGSDPRRRHHPGADAGAREADPPHLRVDPRRPTGDRAPLQLDLGAPAPRRVPPGPRRASPTSRSGARS